MSKRRPSRNSTSDIGRERISILIRLAEKAVAEGDDEHAVRYVNLARRIGMRTRTEIPKDFRFCKGCGIPLVPGRNCRVRLGGHKVITVCGRCGEVKRMPYIREQRK
ncbi:MAG: ribonuclease P protein component 4 [Candidatus Methanomethylophilaceae archaeon]|nr:ribonuclease P protein component 4 [Candidatus Methanomethylophilaceae archaeon]